MKEITADMIKELRERTGVGMGKCKEALVLAEGDLEKAIDILHFEVEAGHLDPEVVRFFIDKGIYCLYLDQTKS